MAKKTPIDKFNETIEKILDDYNGEVCKNIEEITVKVGKAGVNLMRQQSKQTFPKGSGFYAKGWNAETEESRLGTTVTIYNKHAGLPHLLEYGHAKRGGGRVPGRTHIATVEQEVIDQFTREITNKL